VSPYETKMSQIMSRMAAGLLEPGVSLRDRHDELVQLAEALREALNNPTGPLAQLAIQAYDEWIGQ